MHYTVALSSAQVNVNAAALQPLAGEPVVKNDSDSAAIPSIKLDAISAPAAVHASDAGPTAMGKLKSMEASRRSWETTELAASNKRLYSILLSAYSYYSVMKTDEKKEVRQEHADTLTKFITERGYKFTNSTHDMTRVVKCVFGTDRRRVSAYSIALREALRQEIAPVDLVTFIEENGGVEQIRLGGTKPLSATKRAEKVMDEVKSAEIGLIKLDPKLHGGNSEWNDQQVVIVATYLPTGEFQVNAVVKHDSAVNAALAGYYSQKQAKLRADAFAAAAAEKKAAEDAKAAADNAAKLQEHEAKKAAEETARIAAVKAERNEQDRLAKQQALFQSLVEAAAV